MPATSTSPPSLAWDRRLGGRWFFLLRAQHCSRLPRSWLPDKEGRPVRNRPEPGLPNTGEYKDGLANKLSVFAIGNPAAQNRKGRLATLHDKASGFGIARFNAKTGAITMECWRLLIDAANPKPADQFPGWPKTIRYTDNYGRKPVAHLPMIKVQGLENPVLQVKNAKTGELVYALRIRSNDNYEIDLENPHQG